MKRNVRIKLVGILIIATLLFTSTLGASASTIPTKSESQNITHYLCQTGQFDLKVDGVTHRLIELNPEFKGKDFTVTVSVSYVSPSGRLLSGFECYAYDQCSADASFEVYSTILSYDIDLKTQEMSAQHGGEMTVSWVATAQ